MHSSFSPPARGPAQPSFLVPSALLLLGAVPAASAQSAATPDPRLEQVVVTATRTPTPIENLSVPVIVIGREEIERSLASDVGELLQRHAGLEVARTGGPGQAASLFVRGTNSDHAAVLIDGVRINPGTIGGGAIHNIAPESVERIEVVKGPRSTLYGTDAIGGVVNVMTRAGSRRGLGAALSGGRYGTGALFIDGGTALGEAGSIGFSAGHQRTDGFPARTAAAEDSGFENTTLNVDARVAATQALTLRARGWRASGRTEYADFLLAPVSQDFENAAYAFEAGARSLLGGRVRAELAQVRDEIRQNDSPDFVRTRRNSAELQGDWQAGDHGVTAGAVLSTEDTAAESFGTGYDVDTDVNLFYLQDRLGLGRHDLLLAIGYTDHATFGGESTWNAEYGVRLGESGTRLSVAAGKAYHAPDSTDRFGFGGNPQLRPEVSRQAELMLRQPIGTFHAVFVTGYQNEVEDLINYVVTDFTTFAGRNENVGRARIRGVEAGYEFSGERWRARAEVSLADPVNLETDERLLRRARETWIVSVGRAYRGVDLALDVLHSGERLDFGFPQPVALDAYTRVDVGAGLALSRQWSLQARIENLLDERYELARGYNTPRRAFTLATRYRFE
jgi:vitamin B12 transporter